jgi:hypothetical protein
MQVEARIDQDPIISQQLTLWNQQGSQVIRGNLLVIPIEEGLLYVEPLFLQAERSQLPELRRVIVASGARIIMAPSLDEALAELFAVRPGAPGGPILGTGPGPVPGTQPAPSGAPPPSADIRDLSRQALETYRRAQELLRRGDLAGYGREIERLGAILERLNAATQSR